MYVPVVLCQWMEEEVGSGDSKSHLSWGSIISAHSAEKGSWKVGCANPARNHSHFPPVITTPSQLSAKSIPWGWLSPVSSRGGDKKRARKSTMNAKRNHQKWKRPGVLPEHISFCHFFPCYLLR